MTRLALACYSLRSRCYFSRSIFDQSVDLNAGNLSRVTGYDDPASMTWIDGHAVQLLAPAAADTRAAQAWRSVPVWEPGPCDAAIQVENHDAQPPVALPATERIAAQVLDLLADPFLE